MGYEITRVDVWAGEMEDRPGALASKLEAVQRAGADLEFIVARRQPERPGTGVLFVAPLHGPEQTRAAEQAGLTRTHIHSLRIVGPDRPGLAAGIARTLADAGLNIIGVSAAAFDDKALIYLRFETEDEVVQAARILTSKLG